MRYTSAKKSMIDLLGQAINVAQNLTDVSMSTARSIGDVYDTSDFVIKMQNCTM